MALVYKSMSFSLTDTRLQAVLFPSLVRNSRERKEIGEKKKSASCKRGGGGGVGRGVRGRSKFFPGADFF